MDKGRYFAVALALLIFAGSAFSAPLLFFGESVKERFWDRELAWNESPAEEETEGIEKIIEGFPQGFGRAVLDSMADEEYGIWSKWALEEVAKLDSEGELENFYFRKSRFTRIGQGQVDALARAGYKDFYIEASALRNKLRDGKSLYSKVVRESKRFKGAWQDITLVIVLKKGTMLGKREIEKTIWQAYENSKNLEVQNISRVAVYDEVREKPVTVYGKLDWKNGKP